MNGYQRKRVLEAMDNDNKLTEWEVDFINSLADQDEITPARDLSEKQNDVLNRITQRINN